MKKRGKRINWKVLIFSFVVVYGIAFLGSIFTSSSVDSDWYSKIKPAITPPNLVFPIVWNILFFLISISLYLLILNRKKKKNKKALILFGINLILNALWTLFYFRMQNPLLAFYEIILLWILTFLLTLESYKIDKTAGYLLVPYLTWLSFATVLNYLSAF